MEIKIGDFAETTKSFSKEEVVKYNEIIGDTNPIHFDENYASQTSFKRTIVPGLLVTSLFGGLLGSQLPGEGTILIGHTTRFIKPTFINDKVKARIEVIKIREDKPIITFATKCLNSDGDPLVEGESIVFFKGKFFK